MSRKAETMYTAKMMSKTAEKKRRAARNARRLASAFERFCKENSGEKSAYVSVNGIAMPVLRQN